MMDGMKEIRETEKGRSVRGMNRTIAKGSESVKKR